MLAAPTAVVSKAGRGSSPWLRSPDSLALCFWHAGAVALALIGFGSVMGCSAEREEAQPNALAVDTTHTEYFVPLPPLAEGRYVLAADLAIGQDRALHCVVSISYGPKGASTGTNLYYLRGERQSAGWDWSLPQVIVRDRARNARVLIAGDRLHILTGLFIDHYISEDNGRTWRDDGALVDRDSASTSIVDVASVGDTLIVAYTSWLRSPSGPFREDDSRTRLHVVRWLPNGARRDEVLAEYPVPARSTPGPRLAVAGRAVHLIAGIRDDPKDWSAGTGIQLSPRGSIMQFDYYRSADAGRTWTRRSGLPLPREVDLGKYGTVGDVGFRSPDLALAASATDAWAFWGLTALHGHRLLGDDHWGEAQSLSDHPIKESDPILGSVSIQAVGVKAGTIAAWISMAHARPETGPDWYPNSDIYLTLLAREDPRPRHVRITGATTYPRAIRMRAQGDSVYILRQGFDTTSPDGYDPNRRCSFYCIPIERLFPTTGVVR